MREAKVSSWGMRSHFSTSAMWSYSIKACWRSVGASLPSPLTRMFGFFCCLHLSFAFGSHTLKKKNCTGPDKHIILIIRGILQCGSVFLF